MLDADLAVQLKGLFADLSSDYVLSVSPSSHEKHAELLELLGDVASTSARIAVSESGHASPVPRFSLL